MEPRFRRSLDKVRVHTGNTAARTSRGLDAAAFTYGRDIVFGENQYAPHTNEGRNLLAHELAHVVQQGSGLVEPAIQRRLLTNGSRPDIRDFLGMLQSGSGLSLKYDAKSKLVSYTGSVLKPRSSVLALRLAQIIDDPKRDARIHLGRTQESVSFGAFPADLEPEKAVQELRIDHFLALEDGVPGSGIALLAHELVENYEAQLFREDLSHGMTFGASHDAAIETENLVARELLGPGQRRSSFTVFQKSKTGGPRFAVRDMGEYFIVFDQSGTKSVFSNARRVGRIRVGKFRIDGFDASSTTIPKSGAAMVKAIIAAMKNEPTASALLEANATAGRKPQDNLRLSARWADLVQDEIIDGSNDVLTTNFRRFDTEITTSGSGNSVTVTLERPDL